MTIYAIPSQLKLYPPQLGLNPTFLGIFSSPNFRKFLTPQLKLGGMNYDLVLLLQRKRRDWTYTHLKPHILPGC